MFLLKSRFNNCFTFVFAINQNLMLVKYNLLPKHLVLINVSRHIKLRIFRFLFFKLRFDIVRYVLSELQ